MRSLHVDNVNEALQVGMMLLKSEGEQIDSRNGPTYETPYPVTTIYHKPWRRVLFDPLRDANPFFHFMEGLWIIAGRNDVAFLDQFNSGMKRYSQDGLTFHGAYGYRLRHHFGFDQLNKAIEQLRIDPLTRRCVLQMWDSRVDMEHNVDIPCNDLIMFRARFDENGPMRLDMTVCNRSNDIIWGAYGANAVHFSMLHEYVASRARLELGNYHQVSNSYHAYDDNPYWRAWESNRFFTDLYDTTFRDMPQFPLFNKSDDIDEELYHMLELFQDSSLEELLGAAWDERSNFVKIAFPMMIAWQFHKRRQYDKAIESIALMPAGAADWSYACVQWLDARRTNWEMKNVAA